QGTASGDRSWRLTGTETLNRGALPEARLSRWRSRYVDLFAHAGADGGARRRAISARMSANISRGTATSAIWNMTERPWLTTSAPILINFSRRLVGWSRRLVSDHGSAVVGTASVRMKLPRL